MISRAKRDYRLVAKERSSEPTEEIAQCYIDCGQYLEFFEAYTSVEQIPKCLLDEVQWGEVCRINGTKKYLIDIGKAHPEYTVPIISAAIDQENLQLAKQLAQAFKAKLTDFPILLQAAYSSSFEHFKYIKKFTPVGLIKLCAGDDQASVAFLRWGYTLGMQIWGEAMATLMKYGMSEEGRLTVKQSYPEIWDAIQGLNLTDLWLEKIWHSEDSVPHTSPKFLCLEDVHLSEDDIVHVTTYSELMKFVPDIEKSKIVGIDAEWRSSLVAGNERLPALLQLAYPVSESRNRVLLIDLLSAHPSETPNLEIVKWINSFLQWEDGPWKIALNFSGDMQKLSMFSSEEWKSNKMSDLQVVVRYALLTKIDGEIVDSFAEKKASSPAKYQCSLSDAAHHLMGKPLQKLEQCSNWEIRPLSMAQRHYAAMDVAVIVAATLKIMRLAQLDEYDPIEELVNAATAVKKESVNGVVQTKLEQLTAKCEELHREMEQEKEHFAKVKESLGIKEWEFVTVSDEVKLCRVLRGIGLNVQMAKTSTKGWSRLVRTLEDHQVALCPLGRQADHHPRAKLQYTFKTAKVDDRVLEVIRVFDVEMNLDNLCERCSECGSKNWRPITRESLSDKLPESVLEHGSEFRYCGGCTKIFWQGSVYSQARDRFAQYFTRDFSFDLELKELIT